MCFIDFIYYLRWKKLHALSLKTDKNEMQSLYETSFFMENATEKLNKIQIRREYFTFAFFK